MENGGPVAFSVMRVNRSTAVFLAVEQLHGVLSSYSRGLKQQLRHKYSGAFAVVLRNSQPGKTHGCLNVCTLTGQFFLTFHFVLVIDQGYEKDEPARFEQAITE